MNVDKIMNNLEKKHPGEVEYLQAVREVLESIEEVYNENPQFESANIIERIIEPDRAITFKVPWVDDEGNVKVNLGYRVQFNNAIGPYKGGLRFHPSVNLSQSSSSLVLSRSSRMLLPPFQWAEAKEARILTRKENQMQK
jgi:glutamate dehydrogenase (NADP+)